MAEDRVHSHIGASSAYRWMNCPGSVRLYAKLDRRPSTPAAALGTAAHELAELSLAKEREPRYYLGESLIVEGKTYPVTEEMVDAVSIYVDKVRADHREHGGQLRVEQPFELDWLYPGMHGTNDASLVPDKVFSDLRIYDYKNGFKPVAAENNVQCMYYALGALGQDNPFMAEKVVVTIVQPNSYGKEAVDTWELYVDDLYAWGKDVLAPAAARTADPDAPCVEGAWCYFCEAAAYCPAKLQSALALLDAPIESLPAIELPSPGELEPVQIGTLAAFFTSEAFESWKKALVATEISLLERGVEVPGRKLVEETVKGLRKWADPEAVTATLAGYGDELFTTSLKSPAQMDKVLSAAKMPKKDRETLLASLVTREESVRLVVVSESDTRAAASKSDPIDMF